MPPEISNFLETKFLVWLLTISRISGLFILMPFFGGNFIPNNLKVILIVIISWLVLPTISNTMPLDTGVLLIVLLSIINFVIGFLIGAVVFVFFSGVQFMGEVFGLQLGFAVATLFDPQTFEETNIIGQLIYVLAMYVFVTVKGPHLILNSIIGSFQTIPVDLLKMNNLVFYDVVKLGSEVFRIGMEIGIPLIAFMVVVTFIIGILSRLMPQMNLFMVGLPLKVLVGILMLFGLLPIIAEIVSKLSPKVVEEVERILASLK